MLSAVHVCRGPGSVFPFTYTTRVRAYAHGYATRGQKLDLQSALNDVFRFGLPTFKRFARKMEKCFKQQLFLISCPLPPAHVSRKAAMPLQPLPKRRRVHWRILVHMCSRVRGTCVRDSWVTQNLQQSVLFKPAHGFSLTLSLFFFFFFFFFFFLSLYLSISVSLYLSLSLSLSLSFSRSYYLSHSVSFFISASPFLFYHHDYFVLPTYKLRRLVEVKRFLLVSWVWLLN